MDRSYIWSKNIVRCCHKIVTNYYSLNLVLV